MRKSWKLEAVRAIAPEDIPRAGPDFSDLLEKLKQTKAAGMALPDGIKIGTVRARIASVVMAALSSDVSVTLTDGTVYVKLLPPREGGRKPGPKAGAKRGRMSKAAE